MKEMKEEIKNEVKISHPKPKSSSKRRIGQALG